MKILKHIFNIVVWVTLSLYLLLLLAVSLPAVQRYLGRQASGLIGNKLGTEVNISLMRIGLFNHVTLDSVRINDQQGKAILTAGRIAATMDLLPLVEGRISISTAQLFGAHATLYQLDSISQPNFQFLLDSLASKDTTSTSTLNLRINSLIVRQSSVHFDRYDAEETPEQLNPQHLHVDDISAHLILKTLTPDSINLNVKRLSFHEQSGLQLDRLSLKFEGGRNYCRLQDFLLRMPGTKITLTTTEANYRFRGDHFVVPSLRLSGAMNPSSIRFSDLACLLPTLKTFNNRISVSCSFEAEGDNLSLPSLIVSSPASDIGINMSGQINGLTKEAPVWMADLNELILSPQTLNFITENLKGKHVGIPPQLARMGNIHMKGTINGTGLQTLRTHSLLSTDAGDMSLHFELDPQRHFAGDIDTKGINLRQLLDNPAFGLLATKVDVSGHLPANGSGDLSVTAKGDIGQFDYNGYQYHNINIDGSYSNHNIEGHLSINDPNIDLLIEGIIEQKGKASDVRLTANAEHLAHKAINLTDRWGDSRLSGNINANFRASSINDAIGTLDISGFTLQSPTENYQLQSLNVASGYRDDGIHFVTLNSDFGHAEITGDFDYETLSQSFTNLLASKLPTLPGLPKVNPQANNNFSIQATIHKSDWIEHLLRVPVRLKAPLTLHGSVNDNSHQVALECDIPQFYYKDGRYDHCRLSILTPLNALQYDLTATKLMADGDKMDLQLTGSAYNNRLTTSLLWDNHAAERMSGKLTAGAYFDTTFDGLQTANISIAPSTMTVKNAEWDIAPCSIIYSDKHLDVNQFNIRHDQQYLLVNGTASKSNSDSLTVSLQGVDVDYVLRLVNFDAVKFSGLATGGGSLSGIFGDLQAGAKLKVEQFLFEDGRMGTLNAQVDWNAAQEQIDIHDIADDGPDAQTYIDGYVSPQRDSINLYIQAEGTHLDFAQSFTQSFTSSVEGHSTGAVRLAGPLSAINLTGQLVLDGRVHVKTLGCDYELRSDTLLLVPNEIMLAHCPIYDTHGNRAMLSGGIHHKELTRLTFDIGVEADNLLAYDFRDFGGDTFYATVFANGRADIIGREDAVTIRADITPQPGTVFVYNAASPDAITDQTFIEWGKPAPHEKRDLENPTAESPTTGTSASFPSERAESGLLPESQSFRDDLSLHLRINCTPDATIRLLMDPRTSDYITLRGTGDLQANYYNKGGFSMFGTYRVSEGTYGITIQDIIKKNFTFNDGGTVVFGGDPYEATLNLQAQHTVNGVSLSDLNVGRSFSNTVRVNCLMNITGQPRQPIVDFDIDLPNVNTDEKQMVRSIINSEDEMNQQVIYLLAVGRFYPQQANNADEADGGPSKTSLAMQSLLSGTLSGQLNSMLGQIINNNNWNFGANISTGDEGWNNAEYEGLVSGRMLNNRLLINGQFGYRDNATTATPSFIGDFDIRYLLYPNGNLALKVYNQTNDRYFTKSSLNTQGIGIIMKKDFSSLRDLLGRRKKKK